MSEPHRAATHTSDSQVPLCRSIVDSGFCKFGSRCRFRHVEISSGGAAQSSNQRRTRSAGDNNANSIGNPNHQAQQKATVTDRFDDKMWSYIGPPATAAAAATASGDGWSSTPSSWTRPPPAALRHGPSSGVPLLLASDMPERAYRSRARDAKSTIHWGQRKLFFSELELFTFFLPPAAQQKLWIVYVGAAPGSHIIFLDQLLSETHDWELIDPGTFDERLVAVAHSVADTQSTATATAAAAVAAAVAAGPADVSNRSLGRRLNLRTEFFNNAAAYELAVRRLQRAGMPAFASVYRDCIDAALQRQQREEENAAAPATSGVKTAGVDPDEARHTEDVPIKFEAAVQPPVGVSLLYCAAVEARAPMAFISDVRSGREDHGNFEEHVHQNMLSQECWVDIVQPTMSMLKFRLPYSFTSRYSEAERRQVTRPTGMPRLMEHSAGWVLLPLWTRPTSTETRLVVPHGAGKVLYDRVKYENQLFFFNSVFRESVHFAHDFSFNSTTGEAGEYLDHRFDAAAELRVLEYFLLEHSPRAEERAELRASPAMLRVAVRNLSDSISREIGSSFSKAAYNRDKIHVDKGARAGWIDETMSRLQLQRKLRELPLWHRNLTDGEQPTLDATRREPGSEPVWHLLPLAADVIAKLTEQMQDGIEGGSKV